MLPSTVANPLAGSSSSSNEIEFPSNSTDTAGDAVSNNINNGSSSMAVVGTTTPSGVPNPISGVHSPIMGAPSSSTAAALNYNNTTIAPSAIMTSSKTTPAGAQFTSTTYMTSLVPSPLASPSASPPHQPQQQHEEYDETETRDTSCDEPPKKEQRRRRPNTIQWAATGDQQHQTTTNTNQQESFQPVNFGTDYRESPRKDSVGSWASSCASHDTSSTQSPTPLSPADHIHTSTGTPSTSATTTTAAAVAGGPSFPQFAATSDTVTTTTVNNQPSSSAAAAAAVAAQPTTGIIIDKRQKRLERNRESARASRRRRKQYLEELETKVHTLSTDMDSGRVHHALEGVKVVAGMRKDMVMKILERLHHYVGDDIDMNDESQGGGNISIAKSSLSSSGVKHNVVPKTAHVPLQPAAQQQSSIQVLRNANVILSTSLSRTQPSFQAVNTFFQQQLKSLILTHEQPITSAVVLSSSGSPILGPLLPSLTPFILWLTLQNDNFFRGGRAPSERLSAARIGERLLHGGLYRVTPSTTAMVNHSSNSGGNNNSTTIAPQQQQQQNGTVFWPLLCHEIGLSYDQEDKIRTAQRLVLQHVDLWVHRHTARATSNVIQSVHDVMGGMMELARKKEEVEDNIHKNDAGLKREEEGEEETLLSILTEEQRMKFLGWALKNQERMKQCATRNVGKNVAKEVGGLEVSNERHVAANMYIIDQKLGKIKQRVPPIGGKYANPSKLKKLGRRPCFESLGGYEQDNNDGESSTKMMSRHHDSSASLKRNLDDMSIGGSSSALETNLTTVTPEAGQASGHAAASLLLKDVLSIIPKPSIQYHHHPLQQQQQNNVQYFEPEPVMSTMPPPGMISTQSLQQHRKTASSTFDDIPMPTPVSVLLQTSDEFLTPSYGGMNDIMGVDPTTAVEPIPFVPEAVASSSISMMSRHQSAPEFRQYLNSPSSPMGMVPVPEEDDFIFDDLPMDADDWLIGNDTLEF